MSNNQILGIVSIICGIIAFFVKQYSVRSNTNTCIGVWKMMGKPRDEEEVAQAEKTYKIHTYLVSIGLIIFGISLLTR